VLTPPAGWAADQPARRPTGGSAHQRDGGPATVTSPATTKMTPSPRPASSRSRRRRPAWCWATSRRSRRKRARRPAAVAFAGDGNRKSEPLIWPTTAKCWMSSTGV